MKGWYFWISQQIKGSPWPFWALSQPTLWSETPKPAQVEQSTGTSASDRCVSPQVRLRQWHPTDYSPASRAPQNPMSQRQNWREAGIWLVDTRKAGGSWQRGKGQNKSIHWHQRHKKGEYQGWANCSAGGRSLKRIVSSWPGSNGDLELKLGNFRKHVICHMYYIINMWLETFSTPVGVISVGQCTKIEGFALRMSF